jgi:hypothetical protein
MPDINQIKPVKSICTQKNEITTRIGSKKEPYIMLRVGISKCMTSSYQEWTGVKVVKVRWIQEGNLCVSGEVAQTMSVNVKLIK